MGFVRIWVYAIKLNEVIQMKQKKLNALTLVIISISALLISACSSVMDFRSDEVSGFNRISIETFGEVIIEQGDQESLTIEAPRDYLRYITSEVEDGTLTISTRRGFIGGPVRKVVYTINVKDLDDLSLSGAGAIKVYQLETGDFQLNLTGAGSIEIDDLQADTLEVNFTSAGAIVVAGEVESQDVSLSGVGSYEAGDLRSNTAKVLLTGAGSAVVWAEKSLDVSVTGVGSVAYYGKDPDVRQNVSGLGSVNHKGEH
jgi:hypothetical protein